VRRGRVGEAILHGAEMAETLRESEGVRDFSGGGVTDDGGDMYAGSYGSNYQRTEGLYGADLTREIRSDLQSARAEGYNPAGYRLRGNKAGSSSSHQALNVLVTAPGGGTIRTSGVVSGCSGSSKRCRGRSRPIPSSAPASSRSWAPTTATPRTRRSTTS